MINRLEVLSGYAKDINRLKNPVEFKPGLNILFGQNGCGKSTTLRLIATYSGIHREGGWSQVADPHYSHGGEYPELFANKHSLSKCTATVDWDGTPSLLANPVATDSAVMTHFNFEAQDSPDGMTTIAEQMSQIQNKISAGQTRMKSLAKYINTVKNPPDLLKLPKGWEGFNDMWTGCAHKFIRYVQSLPRTGPVTFLMDEPDRSLSIANQRDFWELIIPDLAKQCQVIVATHSVFSLIHQDANWIEFEPNGLQDAMQAVSIFNSLNVPKKP